MKQRITALFLALLLLAALSLSGWLARPQESADGAAASRLLALSIL